MLLKRVAGYLSVTMLAIWLAGRVVPDTAYTENYPAISAGQDALQVWSKLCDTPDAVELLIRWNMARLRMLLEQEDLTRLNRPFPLMLPGYNMRMVFDLRVGSYKVQGAPREGADVLSVPVAFYSTEDPPRQLFPGSYELEMSFDGAHLSVHPVPTVTTADTAQAARQQEAVRDLARYETRLLMDDSYAAALRNISCPAFITRETIRIRGDIARAGAEVTGYLREELENDDVHVAIVVQTGSVLKGYAWEGSDTDYPVVIIFNAKVAIPDRKRADVIRAIREIYEGQVLFAEDIRTVGMSSIPFYPVMYSSSGAAVEALRRRILREIVSEGTDLARKSWDELRGYCQSYTEFGFFRETHEQLPAIRRSRRLLEALEEAGVDVLSDGELYKLINARKDAVRFPDIETMARIYGLLPENDMAARGDAVTAPEKIYSSKYLKDKIIVRRNNLPGELPGQVTLTVKEMSELNEREARAIEASLERWLAGRPRETSHTADIEDLQGVLKRGLFGVNAFKGARYARRVYFALSDRGGEGELEVEALFEIRDRSDHSWGTWLQARRDNRQGDLSVFTGVERQLLVYAVNREVESRGLDGIALDLAAEGLEKDGFELYTFIHVSDLRDKIKARSARTCEVLFEAAREGDEGALEILKKTGLALPQELSPPGLSRGDRVGDALSGYHLRDVTGAEIAKVKKVLDQSRPLQKMAVDGAVLNFNAMNAAIYDRAGSPEKAEVAYRPVGGQKALLAAQGHMVLFDPGRSDLAAVFSIEHDSSTACSIRASDAYGREWLGHLHISASPKEYADSTSDLPRNQLRRSLQHLADRGFEDVTLQFDLPADQIPAAEKYFDEVLMDGSFSGMAVEVLPHVSRSTSDIPGGSTSDVMVTAQGVVYRHYGREEAFFVRSWEPAPAFASTADVIFHAAGGTVIEKDLTPETLVAGLVGDLNTPAGTADTLKTAFKSYMFSGKTVVIALDEDLKDSGSAPDRFSRALERWQEWLAGLQRAPLQQHAMERLLEGIVLVPFSGPESLSEALERELPPAKAADPVIFAFSRDIGRLRDDGALAEKDMRPVLLNELGAFSEWHYHPWPEIVALTLTKELSGFGVPGFLRGFDGSEVGLRDLGIRDIRRIPEGNVLVFDILPVMDRYPADSHTDRFTVLLQFLQSV